MRPELHLVLETHEGKRAPGVEVLARRFVSGPPPDTETHRWKAISDIHGTVSFKAIEASEPHMPLMMHGVNWYSWQICASHPKYGVATYQHDARQPVEGPVHVTCLFIFERPKAHFRTGQFAALLRHDAPPYPANRNPGDYDKLLRSVFEDDCQVIGPEPGIKAGKVWGEQDEVFIRVRAV